MSDISDVLLIIAGAIAGSVFGFCSMSLVITKFGFEGAFFYMLILALLGLIAVFISEY